MDRHLHKKYIPQCPRNASLVDQYMWKEKDTNKYRCYNGISHPIYDCKGWVNYSLPLEYYPPVDQVHPQIEMTRRMHMQWRIDPNKLVYIGEYPREGFEFPDQDRHLGRTEGFYSEGAYLHMTSDMKPGYPLPDPYGSNRGCSACS